MFDGVKRYDKQSLLAMLETTQRGRERKEHTREELRTLDCKPSQA